MKHHAMASAFRTNHLRALAIMTIHLKAWRKTLCTNKINGQL